jgi:hypothetical protein
VVTPTEDAVEIAGESEKSQLSNWLPTLCNPHRPKTDEDWRCRKCKGSLF